MKTKQLLWEMWENSNTTILRKMQWIEKTEWRQCPAFESKLFGPKGALCFKPPKDSHPTLSWLCCIHFSQMALSMTNKFFSSENWASSAKWVERIQSHSWAERAYSVKSHLSELGWVYCTLYTPRKKYNVYSTQFRISWNELLEYAILPHIPFITKIYGLA